MVAEFSADEVFEQAIAIERYGRKFYLIAAQRARDPQAEELLQRLAAAERQHEEIFEALKVETAERLTGDAWPDPDAMANQYLRAMVNGIVFEVDGDPTSRLTGEESVLEVLHLALQAENDSIAFYAGIRAAMPAEWGADRLDAIIREEMSHVVMITAEIERLR